MYGKRRQGDQSPCCPLGQGLKCGCLVGACFILLGWLQNVIQPEAGVRYQEEYISAINIKDSLGEDRLGKTKVKKIIRYLNWLEQRQNDIKGKLLGE